MNTLDDINSNYTHIYVHTHTHTRTESIFKTKLNERDQEFNCSLFSLFLRMLVSENLKQSFFFLNLENFFFVFLFLIIKKNISKTWL
jgi:hypothetical protein